MINDYKYILSSILISSYQDVAIILFTGKSPENESKNAIVTVDVKSRSNQQVCTCIKKRSTYFCEDVKEVALFTG